MSYVPWGKPEIWPNGDSQHLFLAEAVNKVGHTLFPGDWTEREPIRRLRDDIPSLHMEVIRFARHIWTTDLSDEENRTEEDRLRSSLMPSVEDMAKYMDARARVAYAELCEAESSKERLDDVVEWICQRAAMTAHRGGFRTAISGKIQIGEKVQAEFPGILIQ